MSGDRRTPVGSCAVILEGGDALMIQRTGAHGEGTWSFPGGWVEPGEEPAAAACREAWEEVEVNVLAEATTFLGYTQDSHPEGLHAVTLWFHAPVWTGSPRPSNPTRVVAARWVPLADLVDGGGPGKLFLPVRNGLRKGLLDVLGG